MATTFIATSAQETFVNPSHVIQVPADPNNPAGPVLQVTVFDDNSVNYGLSPSAVFIDLKKNLEFGGFASGDTLVDIFRIFGTAFDDVIRGSDLFVSGFGPVENNPGDNILMGFGGNDILEGRGGADILDGGAGSDTASYELSPAAVIVTVNNPATQAFSASGGDATGDSLVSIENLVGSAFNDTLTGSSNNNVLAGGRGDDTLDGQGGTDTADYSRDSFFDLGNTIDRVVVRLGINGANGTGTEFRLNLPDNFFTQLSVDTLISIENVIGTAGGDIITGNQQGNTLDGRNGDDLIDGGLGSDTLIGSTGNDTVSFASHDGVTGQIGAITLGLNGADGLARHATTGATPFIVESDVLRGIENVIGSNLRETITGNELDNILAGRGGNDNINGGAGNDSYDFRGSAVLGTDTFNDESGTDKVLVSSFNDIQSSVRVGNDLVVNLSKIGSFTVVDHFAGHAIENIVAGSQTLVLAIGLIGGAAAGIISGTDGNETLDGMGGDDMLFAADGHDQLLGGEGNDKLYAGKGDDLAEGGEGDDLIYGDKGHDQLAGNDGNDELYGDKGNDILEGGLGSDLLFGGDGKDVFFFTKEAFATGSNQDVIADMESNDRIDLSDFDTSFRALKSDHGPVSLSVDGGDTILTFAHGTVKIMGVSHLDANDFLF